MDDNKLKDEPSLEQIDDYNDKESPQKRRHVLLIIIFLILFSTFLYYLQ